MDVSKITITGSGHWAVCRSAEILKSDLWSWWIEIEGVTVGEGKRLFTDEQMDSHIIERARAVEFMEKIGPFLPEAADALVVPPDHIPGDSATIKIPLCDCVEVEQALSVLREYFPDLCILAA